jgi:hypothetical protein
MPDSTCHTPRPTTVVESLMSGRSVEICGGADAGMAVLDPPVAFGPSAADDAPHRPPAMSRLRTSGADRRIATRNTPRG